MKTNSYINTTSLHYACCKNRNLEMVKYLVEQGADVNAKGHDNNTPLHYHYYNIELRATNLSLLKYFIVFFGRQGIVVKAIATIIHFA